MSTMETIKTASIAGYGVTATDISLRIYHLSFTRRIARALGTFTLLTLVTCLSALIPIAHFVLVPGMVVVTLIFTVKRFLNRAIIEGGEGVCPHCATPFRVFRRGVTRQYSDVCEGCKREVTIIMAS